MGRILDGRVVAATRDQTHVRSSAMPQQFAKPPLVELIAEVRWGALAVPPQPNTVTVGIGGPDSRASAFFFQLGAKLAAAGFDGVEQLQPFGISIPSQPSYRFKKTDQSSPTLFQAGTNIFTVNTTPPYQTWAQFRPSIEIGIRALIETRPNNEPFLSISVRYIDLFKEDLTDGRSIGKFLSEILDVELTLPQSILNNLPSGAEVRPHLSLTIPLQSGMTMMLNLLEGSVGGDRGVVMDTVVSSINKAIPSEVESVMAAFDDAHDVIRSIFLGMTKKIHGSMKPIGEVAR